MGARLQMRISQPTGPKAAALLELKSESVLLNTSALTDVYGVN